jgi:hypothetical protein
MVAQFQHKYAVGFALGEKMPIREFARFAQNYVVRVSEFVRKSAVAYLSELNRDADLRNCSSFEFPRADRTED